MIAKQIRWCFHDMILKYGHKLGTLRVASWSKTVWTCCDGMLTSSNDLSDAILSILRACRRCFASIRPCQHQRLWSVTFAPSATLPIQKRGFTTKRDFLLCPHSKTPGILEELKKIESCCKLSVWKIRQDLWTQRSACLSEEIMMKSKQFAFVIPPQIH